MKIILALPLLLAVVMVVAANAGSRPDLQSALISRGAYIVNQVAQCTDCHSPVGASGKVRGRMELTGASTSFKPDDNVPDWAKYAPNIARSGVTKDWTDEQLIEFLTSGKTPSGNWANPPMPQFRLSRSDAKAVTAYLRHLPKAK